MRIKPVFELRPVCQIVRGHRRSAHDLPRFRCAASGAIYARRALKKRLARVTREALLMGQRGDCDQLALRLRYRCGRPP
jgi:hypothetical protein